MLANFGQGTGYLVRDQHSGAQDTHPETVGHHEMKLFWIVVVD